MIPCASNALSGKQNHFQSESASHLHIARYWFTKRGGLSCDGVRGRRGAGEAAGKRAAAIGAGAEIRGANCGRAGQGASQWRGAPGFEAGKHHADG